MTPRARRRCTLGALCLAVGVLFLAPDVASGTVEEQRARLPPPAECADPVEGVWMSHSFSRGEWYEFQLLIRRVSPESGDLRGDITSHYWAGSAADEKPPACVPGGLELIVKMPAVGKLEEGGKVSIGGLSWTVDRVMCGRPGLYNPDNFGGTIDPLRQEFQSLNNDGGRFVNEPTVFRRIKCVDTPRKDPTVVIKPPAFAPAKRASGCGR